MKISRMYAISRGDYMNKKKLYIADFNCTFGEENYPLLEYFEEIVYPAFTSNVKRKPSHKNEYFFYNIKLNEYETDKFALTGMIIKKTVLERKSLIDENYSSIQYRDDQIPSHPFSYFTIYLNNHTMVLVKNQSGSPTIKEFEATARFVINEKICELNKDLKDTKFKEANINVTNIPCENSIKDALKKLESINTITLTLYPLNGGDVPTGGFYDKYRNILEDTGSPEGNISIKKPRIKTEEDIEYITNMISQEAGKVKHSIRGKKISGGSVQIKDNDMSEVINIELEDNEYSDNNVCKIIEETMNKQEIEFVGEENKKIYLDNLFKIKRVFNMIFR